MNYYYIFIYISDISKNAQTSTERIMVGQTQLRGSFDSSISKVMDSLRGEEFRKKRQLKEFRKDLRRLCVEVDGKNDVIHVSKLSYKILLSYFK